MRKRMHVRGVLLTDHPAIEDIDGDIHDVVQRSAFWLIFEDGNRVTPSGTIEIDSSTEIPEVHPAVPNVITRLKTLLTQEAIIPLRYYGVLHISADTSDEPFLMRINVKDGKLFYQDGHIRWNPENPF